jgi:hypothetical protein|tara:strand:- start:3907 stop:4608 length:702 start_codon:yes stop_codon:yes gene_type:complete
MSSIKDMFDCLTPVDIKHELKRYGNMDSDGGYIFSESELLDSKYIYSYGIGPLARQIVFDYEMADLGKKIYMYDGTISGPALNHQNFFFTKENVDSSNLYTHIVDNGHENENNITAQIDIENSEYEMFSNCEDKVFDVFSHMNVEFHGLHDFSESKFKTLKKLSDKYYAYHIHVNNWKYKLKDGYPEVIEVSYIRKDRLDFKPETYSGEYPIEGLDVKNNPENTDPVINWWRK